jgi:hypothetical protein
MAHLKGSRDGKQRERRTKTTAEKKKDAQAKIRKKARDEVIQREKNGTNFRTSDV